MSFSLNLPTLPGLPGISISAGENQSKNQTNITNNFYNNGGNGGGFMQTFNALDQATAGSGNFALASSGPNGSMAIAGSFGNPQQVQQQGNNPLLANKQLGAALEQIGGDLKDDGMLNKSNQKQNPMKMMMQFMKGMMQMMMGMMGMMEGQGQQQNNPLQMLGL